MLDRTGTGWSVVELDNGTCVAPSTPQVTSAPSTATTSGIRATPVSESLVMIVAGTVLLLATIVGVAVYNVRARALETELTKLALRDRRCSAAREVASYCSVLLALLELKETGEHGLHSEREKLRTACANYRSNAPKT